MNSEAPDSESALQQNASKKLAPHKIILTASGLVVVVVVLLLAKQYFDLRQKHQADIKNALLKRGDPNPTNGKTADAPLLTASKPDGDFANLMLEADKLAAVSDREGAIKKLESYMPKVKGKDQEFAVASRLSSLYFSLNNWQQAISWGERAQKTQQSGASGLNLTIAKAAEALGDKPKAVAAYRAALEVIKNEKGSFFDGQRQQYQDKIKALGG